MAYFGRFESYYPNAATNLRPPLEDYNYGRGQYHRQPPATAAPRSKLDPGGPYVGRQYLERDDINHWGYTRQPFNTQNRRITTAAAAPFSRTQPTMANLPNGTARTPFNLDPPKQRAPGPGPGEPVVPSYLLTEEMPIARSFLRHQRNGFTRNRKGGYWTDFDPTH